MFTNQPLATTAMTVPGLRLALRQLSHSSNYSATPAPIPMAQPPRPPANIGRVRLEPRKPEERSGELTMSVTYMAFTQADQENSYESDSM